MSKQPTDREYHPGRLAALPPAEAAHQRHITKGEPMSLLMIKQGVKDKFTLIAAIITDDDAEPIEHLKRLFQPKAVPSDHYEIEVHPTPTGIPPEFKNRLITDQKTLDGLEEIVRANVEGRN